MKSAFALLALLVAAPACALADDVRDFAPNRPSRSDSPYTVPPGLVQFESDFANYTTDGDVLQALDPTMIFGLTHLSGIEFSLGGLVTQKNNADTTTGFGDVVVRLKLNLVGDDSGKVTIAALPYVKIPTARDPLGNGQVEGGVNLPCLFALPYGFGLTVEPEISVLKNALTDGKQASFTGIVNVAHTIAGNLSGFVEIYDQTYTDSATRGPNTTFDFGVAYLVTKYIQLDAGANVGLNRATPGVNVYSGVAFRF